MSATDTKSLTVRQLTVREAADLFDRLAGEWRMHAIDVLMDGRTMIPSPLVFAATGTDWDTFPTDIPPDDLPRLYEEVEAQNPFLTATLTERLERIAEKAEASAAELRRLAGELTTDAAPARN